LRRSLLLLTSGILFASAVPSNAQLLHKKKVNKSTSADNNAEPDKVLYDRAMEDVKHGRQEIGRLNLQTLINTYPDSEYLAKAKLGIADSYYKEGGTANMAQAIQAYKDFIVFFPFLPEAPYAQLQVANAHYRQMEKPDRDRTEARAAEDEYQTFLQKYPNDPLAGKAQQQLRDVQEVLAEGDYRIGYYYYVKGDKRAAGARLTALTQRYPLYSKSDHALWMLADLYETSEKRDIATKYYADIVKNYPKSELVGDAKYKLKAFGVPVPQPDPNAMAWMTANQNAPRPKTPLFKRPLDLLKSGPVDEMYTSARVGLPTMTQEGDTSGTETLHPGGGLQLASSTGGGSATGGSTGKSIVETVPVGAENGAEQGNSVPVDTPAPAEGTTAEPAKASESSSNATAAGGTPTSAASMVEGSAPAADGAAQTATDGANTSGDATKTGDAAKTDDASKSDDANKPADGKESTSKKKKGLKKILPW
jgi:outer membrane protein assembly factor BamD